MTQDSKARGEGIQVIKSSSVLHTIPESDHRRPSGRDHLNRRHPVKN